jgi:hypothetical protein
MPSPARRIGLHRCHGSLDAHLLERQRPRDLVSHEERDLAQQLAKLHGRRMPVAHMGQLMEDQRVVEDGERREALSIGHVFLPPARRVSAQ